MNYKILIPFLLLISINNLYCQNQRAIIYLKNGDTIRPLAKITIWNEVHIRKDKESKHTILDYKKIKKIKINENGIRKEYVYKLAKEGKNNYAKPKLMNLIISGKISLYKINSIVSSDGFASVDVDGTSNITSSFSIDSFYFGKSNSDNVETLFSYSNSNPFFGKSFKKTASEYFKNCNKLVTLIKNKTFTKNDLEEIVEFYNENCE